MLCQAEPWGGPRGDCRRRRPPGVPASVCVGEAVLPRTPHGCIVSPWGPRASTVSLLVRPTRLWDVLLQPVDSLGLCGASS